MVNYLFLLLQPQVQLSPHWQQKRQVNSSQAHLSSGLVSGMPHFLHLFSVIYLILTQNRIYIRNSKIKGKWSEISLLGTEKLVILTSGLTKTKSANNCLFSYFAQDISFLVVGILNSLIKFL